MAVTTTIEDGVAVVTLDDGKMNAVSHEVLDGLHAALDRASADAGAVCIRGNDRALSAGFDLKVMGAGGTSAETLVREGAQLLMRLFVHPQPTVVAVTGHALAAGALLVLACDTRLAVDRDVKIGLNEVAIGLPLPMFALELATARLSKRALTQATVQAEIYDPAGALAAGYVDAVEASPVARALDEARRLAALPRGAYGRTKEAMRRPIADRVLAGLADDLRGFGAVVG